MVLLPGHHVHHGSGVKHGPVRLHWVTAEHVDIHRESRVFQCNGTRIAQFEVPYCSGEFLFFIFLFF
jgi:hypothetical protein